MSGVNLSRLSCPNADYPGPSEVLEPILQHRWLLTTTQAALFPFKALHFVAFDVASGQGLSGIIMTVYHIVPISILTHLLPQHYRGLRTGSLGKELGTEHHFIKLKLFLPLIWTL